MTQETITPIALDDLHESPFNPRKAFTGLEELAANIRSEGRVHEPLLVRPRLTNKLRDDLQDGFEIVFGHRRYRAAALAGLATVPCMVRAMTDAEARSAQAAENLQRENVHAFEEAQGYADMVSLDGLGADAVAAKVGKSKSHVYGRLKLLEACAEIRAACLAGEIGSEVALLVARLRTERLQAKALAAIRSDTSQHANLGDGGKKSFRHIRDLLAEKFTLELKTALFDREDATLLPDAGACSACPKRTGNAPEFADLAAPTRDGVHRGYTAAGGPHTCTDPDCFDAKKTAHLQRQAQKLTQAGTQVITGNKARAAISAQGEVKGDFIALDDVKKLLKTGKAQAANLAVVSIQDPRTGQVKKAVKRAELVTAGVLKASEAKPAKIDHRANFARQDAQRKANMQRAHAQSNANLALLRHVRDTAAGRERTTFELRMVASAALAGVQWSDKDTLCKLHGVASTQALQKRIDTYTAAELTTLLLDCILVDHVVVEWHNVDRKPGPLLALAHHYGIDVKAAMQASVQPAAPPAAEPASAPASAGAGAKKPAARAKTVKSTARAAKYRCPATGMTWSGKGLQPAWLKAALLKGATLEGLQVQAQASAKPKAKAKGPEVKDEAGCAGADATRDPNTADMFEEAHA